MGFLGVIAFILPLLWAGFFVFLIVSTGHELDAVAGMGKLAELGPEKSSSLVRQWAGQSTEAGKLVFVYNVVVRLEGVLWISVAIGVIYATLFTNFNQRHPIYLTTSLSLLGAAAVHLQHLFFPTPAHLVSSAVSDLVRLLLAVDAASGLMFLYLFFASRSASSTTSPTKKATNSTQNKNK